MSFEYSKGVINMFAYVEKDKDYFDFMVLSQLNMDNLFKQPTDFNVE